MEYHPCYLGILTVYVYRVAGQYQVGSLTGAVASQNVTEAFKGSLRLVGNQPLEYKGRSELDCEIDGSSGGALDGLKPSGFMRRTHLRALLMNATNPKKADNKSHE